MFAPTLKVTVPAPVPAAPLVTVRNPDSLAAVHVQVAPVVTVTCSVPAGHSTSRCRGFTQVRARNLGRHRRAARRLPAVDHRRHLIGVAAARLHPAIRVPQAPDAGRDPLPPGACRAVQRVGDLRRQRPRARVGRRPRQRHLRRADRRGRRQLRAGPELAANLLPRRPPVAVHVQRQGRILPVGPEVPWGVDDPSSSTSTSHAA